MKLKPLDIIIIIILIIIALGSSAIPFINSNKNYNNKYVEIELKGKLYKRLPLDNNINEKIVVESDLGKNIVEISNGKVRIIDSDCPDKICIQDGAISTPGSMLVCLPHKLVVQIKGENEEADELSF
ncbi:hypothetical protein SAMN05428976_10176 [Clostridium sp. USBA 49]|jgi:hypothetical protein|uniref:NusG domain II-containing protein n=1 Tax=Clostridium TaxID=1485 RepID=UPI00099A4421|nr:MULTISPECIES: NusG domain II-containing protein [Clostridium]SKA72810.1 hypothetical protein SAMN05428976_10176 [Clostridium sp. USBA 49]